MFLNSTRRRFHRPLLLSLILILCTISAHAQTFSKDLANGVTLTQKVITAGGPQVINALKIDPKAPGVRVQAVIAQDKVFQETPSKGCESVSSMAKRLNAIAAVNGDFFPMGTDMPGDPLNLMVRDGEPISEPMSKPAQRVVFGITSDGRCLMDSGLTLDARVKLADGKWFPIRGINRKRRDHELIIYTDKFCEHTCTAADGSEAVIKLDSPLKVGTPVTGTVSDLKTGAGDCPISDGALILSGKGTGAAFLDENLKPGTLVTVEFTVKSQTSSGWDKVVQAVGGGSWLVKDGKEFIDAKAEGFGAGFYAATHPRTAAGVTSDGMLILVTVDGRQSISGGMSLSQLAKVMLSQGCVQAANLDGGGSTTMASYYGILNSPSGGIERQVSNGVAVFAEEKQSTDEAEFTIAPIATVLSGTSVQVSLLDVSGQQLSEEITKRVIWSTRGGAGFIDQSGRFYGIKARNGEIVAKLGSRIVSIPVETIGGVPDKVSASLKADASGAPNRAVLVVSVSDLNSNGVGGAQVAVKVTGGTADQPALTTDERGSASTGITWDGMPGAGVAVACGKLTDKATPSSK